MRVALDKWVKQECQVHGSREGRMREILRLLLAPLAWLFAGAMTSGTESCDYLRRLSAVPTADSRAQRRAA